MSEIQNNNEAIDDAALDAELQKSIDQVKAGKTITETPSSQADITTTTEVKTEVKDVPSDEGAGDPQPVDVKDNADDFRIPNKGKFESDEAYEKRVELFDLVKKRKAATTPEALQALSNEISKSKDELKILSKSDKNLQTREVTTTDSSINEDPAVVADREKLKAAGGVTMEEVQKILQEERTRLEVSSNLTQFVGKHPQLNDPDVREVFFDFVDSNFNWQDKSGKELTTTLELAFESMFKPAESIQDRVLKSANVHEKVNAMQFPGSTGAVVSELSPELKASIEELKSTGMSEEKALELLSE